ncbi:MAG: hypothetical protein ABL982_00940 [Vicinamibacterales bacterium]
MNTGTAEIALSPSAVPRVLGVLAVLLVVASVAGQIAKLGFGHDYVMGLVTLFNVDAEQNIPTYFSVLLLLTAAFLLAVTAVVEARANRARWPWALLSSGFLCIGYDEAFQAHEQLIDPMRRILGGGHLGLFSFAWVVPGLVLVCLLSLVFLRFLIRLPAPTRRRFVLAAVIYLGGAIGMEMVGGWTSELHGEQSWQYSTMVTIEESLEMAGLITFVWALLQRWADGTTDIVVRFRQS